MNIGYASYQDPALQPPDDDWDDTPEPPEPDWDAAWDHRHDNLEDAA